MPGRAVFVLSVHPSSYGFSRPGDVRQLKIFPLTADWTNVNASGAVNATLPFPEPNRYDGKLEAPALFYDGGSKLYYLWTSHCTYWWPNDARLLQSAGLITDKIWPAIGNPTHNETSFDSQSTHILSGPFPPGAGNAPIVNPRWIYIADRFEPYVTLNQTGRYVFLPITLDSKQMPQVHWYDRWRLP